MTHIDRHGNEATVRVAGDLVASVAEALQPELKALVAAGVRTLTVDLEQAEFVDSMGVGLLIAAHNTLELAGGSLVVVNARTEVHRLLQTMRLDRHFRVLPADPGRSARR